MTDTPLRLRRRSASWAFAMLAAVLAASGAGAQEPTLAQLVDDWQRGRYADAARGLVKIRGSVPVGERVGVDLLIASALCRSQNGGDRPRGREWIAYIRTHHVAARTDPALQARLAEEEQACRAPTPRPMSLASAQLIRASARPAAASVSIRGAKNWSLVCGYRPGSELPAAESTEGLASGRVAIDTTRVLPSVSGISESSRSRATAALQAGLVRLGRNSGATVVQRGSFVLGSTSGHTLGAAQTLVDALQLHLEAARVSYGLPAPDSVVYAVVARHPFALEDLLPLLGVQSTDRGQQVIGASNDAVPALAAVLQPATTTPGTLAHELIHVLVRRHYPDAPLWLDEGMASLSETADVEGGRIVPRPNWRGRVLQQMRARGAHLPLERLLAPRAAVSEAHELAHRSALEAVRQSDEFFGTARYFTMFLSERGVLTDVYNALRARPPVVVVEGQIVVRGPTAADALEAVARTLNVQPAEVQPAFDAWLTVALSKTPATLRC